MVDLTNTSQVTQIIREIEGIENQERRRYEWRAYEIYSGDQRKHILKTLQERYPVEHDAMSVSNVNIEKKVVDKKAKVYKDAPKRSIGDESNENIDRIYAPWNLSFQEFDIIFNRHKCALGWVQNNPLLPSEFKLLSLSPYTYDLVINPDTFEIEAVILNYPDGEITRADASDDPDKIRKNDGINQGIAEGQQDSAEDFKTYVLWTSTQHIKIQTRKFKTDKNIVETRIDYIIDPENPNMINPLGMLPFVWVTTDPFVPEFPISSPLSSESININVLNSDVLTAMSHSMGQLVLKYPEGSKIKQLYRGHTMNIELPQSNDPDSRATEADFINPGSDLAAMSEVVRTYAQDIIADEGIANFSLAGGVDKFSSGFDRALAMADVTEIREENQAKYRQAEKDIFEIIKAYDSVNKTGMFKEDDKLQIDYTPPKILIADKEKLDIIKQKQDMGLILSHEKHMLLNPGLSEEDAIEREVQIQEEKKKSMSENLAQFNGGISADNQKGSEQESKP